MGLVYSSSFLTNNPALEKSNILYKVIYLSCYANNFNKSVEQNEQN